MEHKISILLRLSILGHSHMKLMLNWYQPPLACTVTLVLPVLNLVSHLDKLLK